MKEINVVDNDKPISIKPLTEKQGKALGNYMRNGGNKTQAALDAGYSDSTAHNAQRIFQAPAIVDVMDKLGINQEYLVIMLQEGLEAEPIRGITWSDKLGYLRLAHQLKGNYSNTPDDGSQKIIQLIQQYYLPPDEKVSVELDKDKTSK